MADSDDEFDLMIDQVLLANLQAAELVGKLVTTGVLQNNGEGPSNKRPRGPNKERGREEGHDKLIADYFSNNPVYNDEDFKRRFRMSRRLFLRIVNDLERETEYFKQHWDARGVKGFSALQKCTSAIRQLAYGTASDASDEYLRMSETTSRDCLENFCKGIIYLYMRQYLRKPTASDIQRIYAMHEQVHGLPGMLGSIDCMHWAWKNCPVAWRGQFHRGDHAGPTVILEAVASYDEWIWHAFFGVPGATNDIIVVNQSPVFNDLFEDKAPDSSFVANNTHYNHGYYLADGIYPEWTTFVKAFRYPHDDERRIHFKERQESARKDIERTFATLQSKWHMVKRPARVWTRTKLQEIMYTCIILHNMIREDEGISNYPFDPTEVLPEDIETNISEADRARNVNLGSGKADVAADVAAEMGGMVGMAKDGLTIALAAASVSGGGVFLSVSPDNNGGDDFATVVGQMASTVTSTNNLSLRSILEKDKLTGSNFLDWERNLMIVLRHERKWYVLEEPLGEAPPANAPAAARNAHKKHSDDLLDVACLMLATMSPDLQAGLINTNAYDMIRQLRDMFQTQARTERYDATKAFNECKMVKGTSVSDHVMKMKRHLDHLERLGHPVPLQLATDTILNSLSEDYRPFVVNYNMNNMEKTIAELHSMLKTAELNMGNKNKTKDVLMVKDGGVKKKNGHASTSKGKGPVQAIQSAPKKGKGKGKGKKVKPNKARTENRCFICNEIGHWRQNCPKRHEAGSRNHSSTQQLRRVAVLHIQELEVSPGSYDQLLNNSYKCCRLKVAQIFDRVANIGRDPRLRLLLGKRVAIKGVTRFSGSRGVKGSLFRGYPQKPNIPTREDGGSMNGYGGDDSRGCCVKPADMEINKGLIKMIFSISFDGRPGGEPYKHLEAFEDICDLFNATEDEVNKIKAEIRQFKQGKEHLAKAWERYKDLLLKLPNHGIDDKEVMDIFYAGLTNDSRLWLDSSCGGIFHYKIVTEAPAIQMHKRLNAPPTECHTWKSILALSKSSGGIIEQLFHHFSKQGKTSTNEEQQIRGFVNFVAEIYKSTDQILREVKGAYPYVEIGEQAEVFTATKGGKNVVEPPMPKTDQIPNMQVVEPEIELSSLPRKEVKEETVGLKESTTPHEPTRIEELSTMDQSMTQHEVIPPWSDSDDSDDEFSWQVNTTEKYHDEDCLDGIGTLMQDDQVEESTPEKASPDQSVPQQKVSQPFVKSDDSNSSLILQDETMGEQSDGEDFEQEGYEEQTPKENLSPIQPKVNLPMSECNGTNNEPLFCQVNQYKDPFWEASCQKQLVEPTHIMEYLKDLIPRIPNPYTHSAKKRNTNQSNKWCATLPGGSQKDKSVNLAYPFSYDHDATTTGEHAFLQFKPQPQYDETERKKLIKDLDEIKGRHIEIGRTLDWVFLHTIQAAGHILRYFERGPSAPASELSSMAWIAALDLREPIYRELTLEFIATYSFDEDSGRESVRLPCITYRLGGRWFRQTLAQFAISLRLYTADMVRTDYFEDYIGQCALAPPEGIDYSALWSQLGRGQYRRSNTKSGSLVDPEHRVLHRMIAYTLN
ncbi:hypothetical protein OSB04_017958 [Centaurea solstitialis]|uniref:CCHC-type domain-containing protein n=1 Tax=Centaurea solstitialis TaxID=347529 RepID=A0AA38TNU7_9ASTR|nr:hypothetical protein OSB04_017958 [Centaurea solstitialis]